MIGDLLGLLGFPPCARKGCKIPAFVRFEFTDENGPVWVNLCPMCLTEIRRCIEEMGTFMDERRTFAKPHRNELV